MDSRIEELARQGDALFAQRLPLMSFWQEIAEHFYPVRADFTQVRTMGAEFMTGLSSSYPALCHRDFASVISSIARPKSKHWFEASTNLGDDIGHTEREWLERASGSMRRAMYDRVAQFDRATTQADNDFVLTGSPVMTLEYNPDAVALLYQTWHLRDVAWCEDTTGAIADVHHKFEYFTYSQVNRKFKGNVAPAIKEKLGKTPHSVMKFRRAVVRTDNYSDDKKFRRFPFVSVYYDHENNFVMEEIGIPDTPYIIPRWMTVPGSQYAYSPAVVIALPDARLLQDITLTLLEAGQKAVDPPMIATENAVRSDIGLFAGGITWVDSAYDERLGDALRPITQDRSGLQYGMHLSDSVRQALSKAFYLDRVSMAPLDHTMTALEVSTRVQEYVRNAAPIIEPVITEYDGQLCEKTFALMLRQDAFRINETLPDSLRGEEIQFKFSNPLYDTAERAQGQVFMESKALIAEAMALDPSAKGILNVKESLRGALKGIGTPANWLNSAEEEGALEQAEMEQAAMAQTLQGIDTAAGAALKAGQAASAFNEAAGVI